MTKDDIFKLVIGAIATSVIKPLIEAYMPSKDKLKLYIKRFLSITFAYILPIGILTKLFLDDSPVDKVFIFKIALFLIILILNISMAIFEKFLSSYKSHREDIIASFKIVIQDFGSFNEKHLDLTTSSVDATVEFQKKTTEILTLLKDKVEAL